MHPMPATESFDRIAATAARLFLERGYDGVSLSEIADDLDIKAASLYYHCPGGKSELFTRSLLTFLDGYRRGLGSAPGRAAFPASLYRMTDWMLGQPPLDLQRLLRTEPARLRADHGAALTAAVHTAVLEPFIDSLEAARTRGEIDQGIRSDIAAAAVVALVDGLGFQHLPSDREANENERREARRTVRAALRLLKFVA